MAQKAHDDVVKFDTYRNVQQHRAVVPAIAWHLVTCMVCHWYGAEESLTAPVVHKHKSKDMILGFTDADWLTELVAGANKERHLQFHV